MDLPDTFFDFVEEINEELKNRKLKRIDLAEKLNINIATLSKQLSKKSNMTVKTMYKITEALDMKLIVCLGDK